MLAHLRVPLAILLASSCAFAAGCGGDDSSSKSFASCTDVPYSTQDHDGAFSVKAHSASCDLAESVAGAARAVDLGAESIDYTASGFSCKGILAEDADKRPRIDYTCTNTGDGAAVKFARY